MDKAIPKHATILHGTVIQRRQDLPPVGVRVLVVRRKMKRGPIVVLAAKMCADAHKDDHFWWSLGGATGNDAAVRVGDIWAPWPLNIVPAPEEE